MVELAAAGFWASAAVLVAATGRLPRRRAVVVPVAKPAGSDDLAPWLAFAPIGLLFALGAYAAASCSARAVLWPPFRSAAVRDRRPAPERDRARFTDDVVWVALAVSAGYAVALALLLVRDRRRRRPGDAPACRRAQRSAELLPLRGKVVASLAGGLLGGQVFVFLERLLAASLGVGAVAAISYSPRIAFTPNVLAQSISLGVYPGMLRAHARAQHRVPRGQLRRRAARHAVRRRGRGGILALVLRPRSPASSSTAAICRRQPIVEIGRTLRAFSLALVAQHGAGLHRQVFNALDYFRAIVWSQGAALVIYIVLALPLRPVSARPGSPSPWESPSRARRSRSSCGPAPGARLGEAVRARVPAARVACGAPRGCARRGALCVRRARPRSNLAPCSGDVGSAVGVALLWLAPWEEPEARVP